MRRGNEISTFALNAGEIRCHVAVFVQVGILVRLRHGLAASASAAVALTER